MKPKFDLLLKNADVYLPNSQIVKIDIGVSTGKIKALGSFSETQAYKTLNLQGLLVSPGIIDTQVHFREPGLTHKEDLATGTLSAIHGGVTSIFEMPNTNPSTDTEAAYLEKLNLAKNRAYSHHAFYMGATHNNINHLANLENLAHSPGIKLFMGSSTGNLLVEDDISLEKILNQIHKRLVVHSEDEHRLRERKHIATDSKSVLEHPNWRDATSALMSTQRLIHLARKTKKTVHVLHISTKDEVEFLQNHKDIATLEILPQHLLLHAPECYERLGTLAQQNPPIREASHQKGLLEAFKKGFFDVIGSDHAPHTLEEKAKPYPTSPSGVPGVQTMLTLMLDLAHKNSLPLDLILSRFTENPRRIFNIKNKGRIEVGYDADFTVIDLKKSRRIENKDMKSKSNWTPFDGMTTTGWPVMTILLGEVVMQDFETTSPPQGKPITFES